MNDIQELKRILRKELRERRVAIALAARRETSERIRDRLLQLPEVGSAGSVFCFISNSEEVDTHALIDSLVERGKRVLVPWIPAGGDMAAVRFTGWASLAPGQLGILTPVSPHPFDGHVDVCITPGLGFTLRGERLGYGRGYYDRWFSSHTSGPRVGIGFDFQIVDQLPTSDRDVRLDGLVTEARVIDTGGSPGA
ncbi:MAG: 5-formyltetrahydrofolate cyclo-ligase [Gammaproteobacteria bacterium]|nr:5-formyltetrahydrofolate cyclo-ligase [Gammaproteobacteria bacterium]